MRAVYSIYGTITEEKGMFGVFNYLVPEINCIAINFHKPVTQNIPYGNIVEKMVISFDNNTKLEIEGVVLHKFFDSPPEPLRVIEGNTEKYAGYNPHTNRHTAEELMKLIRQGFLSIIDRGSDTFIKTRYKSIVINHLDEGFTLTTALYPELDEYIIDILKEAMRQEIESDQKKINKLLAAFVKDALVKQKVQQEWVRDETGKGIRSSFTEIEWGDVSRLTLKDILFSLDPYREEGVPYYTHYNDRLKEYSKKHSAKVLKGALFRLESEGSDTPFRVLDYLNDLRKGATLKNAANRLINEDESILSEALHSYWWSTNIAKSVSELIGK